jgi:hypothetical protein
VKDDDNLIHIKIQLLPFSRQIMGMKVNVVDELYKHPHIKKTQKTIWEIKYL